MYLLLLDNHQALRYIEKEEKPPKPYVNIMLILFGEFLSASFHLILHPLCLKESLLTHLNIR